MAAIPDLSTLTSSTQIFSSNHTLPQIRAIHKALHVQIDEKAARLRTQVGGSYRELLGTADAIVRMRDDMDAVQATLGRMGARCGRTVVAGKVGGLGKFVKEREGTVEGVSVGEVARARLLDACAIVVARMLRAGRGTKPVEEGKAQVPQTRGDRLVLASKVLVLSRLLAKSLEDAANPGIRAAVTTSKKTLDGLRKRLIRNIEKVLQSVGDTFDRDNVLKALCAYSLATNSGARDVVRAFLSIRGDSMALAFEVEEHERERSTKDVVRSLGLYTRTLLDVQALVPNKLTEALLALKKDVLLADKSLRDIEGLRLDALDHWCGDEIRYFTPYIRHDDLDGKQARETLTNWAAKGRDVLLQGLGKTLDRLNEFKSIVDMRTDVLQIWIRDGGKVKGLDPSDMLDKLRKTITTRVYEVLNLKVNKLRLVGSEVAAALESWQEGITDKQHRLWDTDSFDMDLSNGASQFTQDVISRLYGRNDAVSKAVSSYKSWYRVIDDVEAIVDQLRRQRWDNDVDEIEEEETLEQRQRALSKDDPQRLHDHLNTSMTKAFEDLDNQLTALWDQHKGSPNSGHIAMYFLRILRDIRGKLPKLEAVKGFGLTIVPSLHDQIALLVAQGPLDDLSATLLSRKIVGRGLGEGDPPLPTSPSPGIFQFLRRLTICMGDSGMDMWSPTAVSVLKQHLAKRVSELWLEALATHLADSEGKEQKEDITNGDKESKGAEEDTGNGDEESKGAEDADTAENAAGKEEDAPNRTDKSDSITAEQNKELLIQWLYDISLLRSCIGPPAGSSRDEIKGLEEVVYEKTGLEDAAARQRLIKASQDYWKRSGLLFGLLA